MASCGFLGVFFCLRPDTIHHVTKFHARTLNSVQGLSDKVTRALKKTTLGTTGLNTVSVDFSLNLNFDRLVLFLLLLLECQQSQECERFAGRFLRQHILHTTYSDVLESKKKKKMCTETHKVRLRTRHESKLKLQLQTGY